MWLAASEARVRRLNESFAGQLRAVFVDGNAAKAVFAETAGRDGLEAAVATLRTTPERFAALRSTEEPDRNVRQPVIDRAATVGAEATVARRESRTDRRPESHTSMSPNGSRPPPQSCMRPASTPRLSWVTNELSVTCSAQCLDAPNSNTGSAQTADRLLPHEVRKLKTMITAPRLALLAKIRSTVRDALLARDERSA